jgi:ubiquitin-like domain-containing CTD phosphatase 1
MIPLWNEIRSFFPLSRNPSNTRLALFSGHDTTLIPLLSSLGTQLYNGTEWIPYASMVIVEIHDIILYNVSDHELLPVKKKFPSFKAFRILYNGHVLTDKVEGCIMASDLCDISYLINQLDSFTTLDYSSACVVSDEEKEPSSTLFHDITHDVSLAKALFHTSGGIAFLILTIFFTAFISSLLTYVMMNRKCPRWCHSRCCHPGEKQRNNLSLRDYESITFNSSLARNENIVKPGWNDDPRRKSQLRYVEVPSWFLNDSEVESREIT